MSDDEKRKNVVRLAFGGQLERLEHFCRAIDEVIPPGTIVVLRGSAVTGQRWKDQAPFDADGPGTSDLAIIRSARRRLKAGGEAEAALRRAGSKVVATDRV